MMPRLNYAPLIAMAGIALCMLPGCGGGDVKETLGLNRVAPDEFRVVARPPLTVPPEFSLLPPSIDATPPGKIPTAQHARDLVLGEGDGESMATASPQETSSRPMPDSADHRFLERAGVAQADPDIRKELVEARVSKQLKEEDESWWDILSTEPKPKDPTVNAAEESERINENQDAGKPVTEGETPTIKPADHGILGRILGY